MSKKNLQKVQFKSFVSNINESLHVVCGMERAGGGEGQEETLQGSSLI